MTDFLSLKDRAAVVTGGAQGIGRAIVELLAQHGASVMVADLIAEKAEETAKEIVGVLLPLLCILALVAVLLSAMMHADHQLEAAALTQMASSSSSTLTQFFNDLFHVYDLTHRWVLSSALLPLNASVQEPNATLDFTHTTWEYGAYDIIQGHVRYASSPRTPTTCQNSHMASLRSPR